MYTISRYGTPFNDTFFGTSADDVYYGYGGNDWFFGSAGSDYYNGGSGSDTVDYRYSRSAVTVDLSAGLGLEGDAAGDRYVSIENVVGTDYDDTLIGNGYDNVLDGGDGDDQLFGGAGDDRIIGGSGNDTIDGGKGDDTLDYSQSDAGSVRVNLADGEVVKPVWSNGVDKVSGIETVIGTADSDWFRGDSGDNVFYGGGGGDRFFGDAGNDTYVGGSGHDTVQYDGTNGQVFVDLTIDLSQSGNATTDVLVDIERIEIDGGEGHTVLGDSGSTTIFSDAHNSFFDARGGDDLFVFGHFVEGNTYDGGAGTDAIYLPRHECDGPDPCYAGRHWQVDLQAGFARDTDLAVNKLFGIENVIGSSTDDDIRGNDGDNGLYGGDGNDYLDGRGGNDVLSGGYDSKDIFFFAHTSSDGSRGEHDVITDFVAGLDLIDLSDADVQSDAFDLLNPRSGFLEQVGEDVVIHTSNLDTVTLQNIQLSDLSQSDFLF